MYKWLQLLLQVVHGRAMPYRFLGMHDCPASVLRVHSQFATRTGM